VYVILVVATETSYCLQAVLATHLFTAVCHRCAKMVTAFSTALNLNGMMKMLGCIHIDMSHEYLYVSQCELFIRVKLIRVEHLQSLVQVQTLVKIG